MTLFSEINLAQLPPPQVVEVLDFEAILSELKADAIARDPSLAEALELESEPLIKLLQVAAYRELVLRQRINDAARATMLAFATGNDLEQLGALFGVERGTVQAADPSANPPVLEILEDDTRLRTRIQLSLEGVTSCGTVGSYFVATLAASALVKDVAVDSPAPGEVEVRIMSVDGNGAPDQDLIDHVTGHLLDDEVRQLGTSLTVLPVAIQEFEVEASVTLLGGPAPELVIAAAEAAVEAYVEAHHRIGHDITIAGLHAAIFQAGVQNVALTLPAADLIIDGQAAAYCTGISLAFGGVDV